MFPDAEAAVVAYLNPLLIAATLTARASTRVPNPRPSTFVRVTRTGGSRRSVAHEDAQITVECWALTSTDAATLTRRVQSWLTAMDTPTAHVPQGSSGWVGGPSYLEDPTARGPRYVMTCIVRTRLQEA